MKNGRQKEILSFFAKGDLYEGPKLLDKNFTEEELTELDDAEYITCTVLSPLSYTITIKGFRQLRGSII